MRVKIWGVRGSIPTPYPEYMKYGGNTPCVEIRTDSNDLLIIDAGTGIRRLGQKLLEKSYQPRGDINLLISHHHWDHIQGFPFFAPYFHEGQKIVIFGGDSTDNHIAHLMQGQMDYHYFPVRLDQMRVKIKFQQFKKEHSQVGNSTIQTFSLNHPQKANGYRIEADGKIFAYASDTEHKTDTVDENVLALAEGADLLIYDCMYTPEEYELRKGWGHSTWIEGLKVARQAGVKRFGVFHHAPDHDDVFMDQLARKIYDHDRDAIVIQEGMNIRLE